MESKLHNDFYSLIEPLLQKEGYTTRFLSERQLLVEDGALHFAITHCVGTAGSSYERVLMESRFKDPRAEELFYDGMLLITNKLSGVYPDYNVVCSTDGRIRIRYCCDIKKAKDILPHAAYASDFFGKIQFEALQAINEMYNNKNNH